MSNIVFDDKEDPKYPYFPHAIIFGAIGSVLTFVYGLIGYNLGIDLPTHSMNALWSLISYAISIGIVGYAMFDYRKKNNNVLPFGRGLTYGVLLAIAITIIGSILTYLLMNVIAPDYMDRIIDVTMQEIEREGGDEASMQMVETMMGYVKYFIPVGLFIMHFIIALIFAAIYKRR